MEEIKLQACCDMHKLHRNLQIACQMPTPTVAGQGEMQRLVFQISSSQTGLRELL